tara:strand:- start:39 stop:308 length:270 start_codon:yes stop_codon:yes gene_type:complete
MKIKLSYFLGKKGVSLKRYCEKSGIKSHEELVLNLFDKRVEAPDESQTRDIFVKRVVKKTKPVQAQKPSLKKSTKTKKSQAKKRKSWSS